MKSEDGDHRHRGMEADGYVHLSYRNGRDQIVQVEPYRWKSKLTS